jgi:hypothetical protein
VPEDGAAWRVYDGQAKPIPKSRHDRERALPLGQPRRGEQSAAEQGVVERGEILLGRDEVAGRPYPGRVEHGHVEQWTAIGFSWSARATE